jgi:hypothetical protein
MVDSVEKAVSRFFEVHLYAPLLTNAGMSIIVHTELVVKQEYRNEPSFSRPSNPNHQLPR